MIQAENYGFHWDDDVAWLVQGRSASNFLGLNKAPPFRGPKGSMCNHLVPTAAPIPDKQHWERFQNIADDPLVRAMFPIPNDPGKRAYFIEDPYDDLGLYLTCLSRMSSPIGSPIRPAWMIQEKDLEKQMMATNIQPWVITRLTQKNLDLMEKIAQASLYTPRTVVMSGDGQIPLPAGVNRITTKIRDVDIASLITLPLEVIGATIIRRFARGEDLTGMIESRQERRARMQKK